MALARSADHEALMARAQQYFPGASNGNAALSGAHSFVIAGGQGAYVYDPDGRRWIDYLLGSGPMIVGHAHPRGERARCGSNSTAARRFSI